MTETKIQILRQTRGYKQKYMADKLGIGQEAYSRIESGQQKLKGEQLRCIANILGVPVDDLMNNQPLIVITGNITGLHNNQDEKEAELAELKRQLSKKDAQIEKLLELLHAAGGVND